MSVSRPRVAEAGDVYLLLQPGEEEVAAVHERQAALQAIFGGRPHRPAHFSCQRFEVREGVEDALLVARLRAALEPLPAFPVVAESLLQTAHSFWEVRLLRWQVRRSDELGAFMTVAEGALWSLGIAPHFPISGGWLPSMVTALEGVGELDLEVDGRRPPFPAYLFTARRVVISRILGRRRFEVLATFPLAEVQRASEP